MLHPNLPAAALNTSAETQRLPQREQFEMCLLGLRGCHTGAKLPGQRLPHRRQAPRSDRTIRNAFLRPQRLPHGRPAPRSEGTVPMSVLGQPQGRQAPRTAYPKLQRVLQTTSELTRQSRRRHCRFLILSKVSENCAFYKSTIVVFLYSERCPSLRTAPSAKAPVSFSYALKGV